MVAVTGPGEITAAIATTKENMKTEASESVDNFAKEETKRHFTGGKCYCQEYLMGGRRGIAIERLGALDETSEIWEDELFEIRLPKRGAVGGFEVEQYFLQRPYLPSRRVL